MSNVKVSFRGYSNVAAKGSKERVVFDNSKSKWTEDDVVGIAYKAARATYYQQSWLGSKYDVDDFMQDAAIDILERFRTGYFDANRHDIFPIIFRLINGHFVFNEYKRRVKERRELALNAPAIGVKKAGRRETTWLDLLAEPTRHDLDFIKEEAAKEGTELIEAVIDQLDFRPFNTRKYTYSGIVKGMRVELTESLIAKLIFDGKDLHDILDVYGHNVSNSGSTSQSAYLAKIVKQTTTRIVNAIKAMNDDEQECVKSYLELNSMRS